MGWNLTSISKSGTTGTYTYNNDGLRTTKTVNGTTTTYTYQGSLLMAQQSTNKNLYFSYDSSGKAVSVNYNGTEYYYLQNGKKDIMGLLDQSGTKVVSYTYDSWGKLIETTGTLAETLGVDNPFRFKGYCFDAETGLYYLNSRYYDPETGRFISADRYISTGQGVLGYNSYAYCRNNPVCRIDVKGTEDEMIDLDPNDPNLSDEDPDTDSIGNGPNAVTHVPKGTSVASYATKGSSNFKGKIGEWLAKIDPSAKKSISVNGNIRIPDELTETALREVKNVNYVSNTSQLRDFATYAHSTGRSLVLVVRPTTKIAKTIFSAGWKIEYLWED